MCVQKWGPVAHGASAVSTRKSDAHRLTLVRGVFWGDVLFPLQFKLHLTALTSEISDLSPASSERVIHRFPGPKSLVKWGRAYSCGTSLRPLRFVSVQSYQD